MKKLLNTLFIVTPDNYLKLDGENVAITRNGEILGKIPLLNLEGIITTSYAGASSALMGACAKKNIAMSFLSPSGKFLCRISGSSQGNVLLRKQQYRISDDKKLSCVIGKNFIIGKIYNQRWMIERFTRDHNLRIDLELFKKVSKEFKEGIADIQNIDNLETLRGVEGQFANRYFSIFDQFILQQKKDFGFYGRNRRPPLDPVNALLSLSYSLLTHDCSAALESVGLDPYVGFVHQDRPGRTSLSLDLVEELRGIYADRFVLQLINNKIVNSKHFIKKENGSVLLTDEGRQIFFNQWQKKKQETIQHPFLKEKISWGLVPYTQALLLARFLREDIDEYPPFLWK